MGRHKYRYVDVSLLYDHPKTGRVVFDPRKEVDRNEKTWFICPTCNHVFETEKQFTAHVYLATYGRNSPYCCIDKQKKYPVDYVPEPRYATKKPVAQNMSESSSGSSSESFVDSMSADSDSDVTDEAKTLKRLRTDVQEDDKGPVPKKQRFEPIPSRVKIRPSLSPRRKIPLVDKVDLGRTWIQWLDEAVDNVLVKVEISQKERETALENLIREKENPAKKEERATIEKALAQGVSILVKVEEKLDENHRLLVAMKQKHREYDTDLESELQTYREQPFLSYDERENQAQLTMRQKRLFEKFIEERDSLEMANQKLEKDREVLLTQRQDVQTYLEKQQIELSNGHERELAESKIEYARLRVLAKQMLDRFKTDFFPAPTLIINFDNKDGDGPVQEEDTMEFRTA